jgi:ATP citrate (pro-S)-lyase
MYARACWVQPHPRHAQGLAAMKALGPELGLPVEVFGPESSMTGICARAIEFVKSGDA